MRKPTSKFFRPTFEALADRIVPTANLLYGDIYVTSGDTSDVVTVSRSGSEYLVHENGTRTGTARVYESQDAAVDGILGGEVVEGEVVLIRYEGPRGGPGMQEMLYPTSYLKSKGLGKACALVTDGRFSGGSSGLSIGHVSPEAAEGGTIGLVQTGDTIEIDIPNRTIHLAVPDAELAARRQKQDEHGWKPAEERPRKVTAALRAYASMTTSAARGAVRDI